MQMSELIFQETKFYGSKGAYGYEEQKWCCNDHCMQICILICFFRKPIFKGANEQMNMIKQKWCHNDAKCESIFMFIEI